MPKFILLGPDAVNLDHVIMAQAFVVRGDAHRGESAYRLTLAASDGRPEPLTVTCYGEDARALKAYLEKDAYRVF